MQSSLSATESAFAEQVQDLLIQCPVPAGAHINPWHFAAFRQALAERGWMAPRWPVKYGGTGWSATQQHIFYNQVCRVYPAYQEPAGIALLGPVLVASAPLPGCAPWQREELMRGVLENVHATACAVFEPVAGFDTRAWVTELRVVDQRYQLGGVKRAFEWSNDASAVVVFARCRIRGKPCISAVWLSREKSGLSITQTDGHARVCEIAMDQVTLTADMPGLVLSEEIFTRTMTAAYLDTPGQQGRMDRLLDELDVLVQRFDLEEELRTERDELAQDIAG